MNSPGTFTFAVLNDLHYMTPEDRPWLDRLVRQVNAVPELELVLVLGDLAEDGSRSELEAARQILTGLSVPWYVVPGNHDGPPNRPIGSGVAGLRDYESLFPKRRNYSFTHKGWQFIGLDTTNGSGYQLLPIPEDTKGFARDAAAALDRKAPTILFTHMPLDPAVRFSSADGFDLLRILAPLNLRIVFSGHFHGLTEAIAPPPNPQHLKLLTNRCCSRTRELHDGSTKRGFFQCRASADQTVAYSFAELLPIAR
ncbi:MAG TPA: metallophosphoesterase [Phycisphaerae bacterium]|nr:metallophosphoesterase [Phycisphaerae bacterium]